MESEQYNDIMWNKGNYLLGQVRALCPDWRQAPQSRDLLAGGSSVAVVVDVEAVVAIVAAAMVPAVVVWRGVDDEVGLGGGVGDREREGDKSSRGADGCGQVTSLQFSGQNSLILMYRYHCRWMERPVGWRTGGSWSACGDHDFTFKMHHFTSGDPALSFTKM